MFVGHALFAFALTALGATRLNVPRERALKYGVVAGLFAAVPDVDVIYAPAGLLLGSAQQFSPDLFWETANIIHRGPTHSLVLGAVLAAAVVLWMSGTRLSKALSLSLAALLVVIGTAFSGAVGGVVVLAFTIAGYGVAVGAGRYGIDPRELVPLALIGLLSHPFGDLFTGSPPPFLYPFDITVVAERIALHPDPTANLLAAFAVELGVVWLAVWTYTRLSGAELPQLVTRRASLGVGYAAAVMILPAPTMEQSAQFVFSVLAIGVVGAPMRPFSAEIDWLETAVTGLAAVTVALAAYALAYGIL